MTASEPDGLTWLAIDSRRLTVGEYWRLSPGVGSFVIAVALKLVRARLHFPSALTREFRWIDVAEPPPWAAALFAGEEPALVAAGLEPVGTYTAPMLGTTTSVARVFVDADGLALTQLMAARSEGPPAVTRLVVACTSRAADDALIATGNLREHLAAPPTSRIEVVQGGGAAVVRRHRERLAAVSVVPCPRDGVRDRLADEHAASVAFHERRGVYAPVSDRRLSALRAATPAAPPPEPLPAATVIRR